jgi:glycosyltransferase involved in cell wall biosynthesis
MIITAYNEEKRILGKIDNTLKLVYPEGKLQVIIASDASTDLTNSISGSYRDRGIELLAIQTRGGKESAQKEALKIARGEIVVFTDVATILEPSGIEKIVSNFADPHIGCVSSEDRLVDRDGNPSGEGFYIRYEMLLRRLESRVNSLVGLSGSFFAARKTVCQDFSPDMQSDFRTLLNSIRMGLRGISDPEVTGSYLDVSESRREFDRKVRTVLRGLTVFFRHVEFLNIFKYGFFSYQYFCHKLLRWFVPWFLVVAFTTNMALAISSRFYLIVFMFQLSFYFIGLWGLKTKSTSLSLIRIPYYFLAVNASILIAWWKYFRRQRVVMWTPSER